MEERAEGRRELLESVPKKVRPSYAERMRALGAVARGRFHRFRTRVGTLGRGLSRRRRDGNMTATDHVAADTLGWGQRK